MRSRSIFVVLCFLCFSCGGPSTNFPGARPQGAWVSSGGELFKDAHNPWWVKSTTQVDYCIQVDEQGFSAKPEMIERQVTRVLDTWKHELAQRTTLFDDGPVHFKDSAIGVGKQAFRKVACTGTEDLRFQFGHGTLTPDQKEYLVRPRRYLGISVRTEYDEVNLKGRGFVFIASDRGENRYDGSTFHSETPWSNPTILYLMLLHETGHLFGIPHVGAKYSLMSAEFPEFLVTRAVEQIFKVLTEDQLEKAELHFFVPKKSYQRCLSETCVEYRLDEAKKYISLVEKKTGRADDVAVLGGIQLHEMRLDSFPMSVVTLVLNPKQTVFPKQDEVWPLLSGPFFMKGSGFGTMKLRTGEELPVHLHLGPDYLEIIFPRNGKLEKEVAG